MADATPWEAVGRENKRWYKVVPGGGAKEVRVDSMDVALITVERGDLRLVFSKGKIAIAGGELQYNRLFVFDRGDTEESIARGELASCSTQRLEGSKEGWIHSSVVKLEKTVPLKVNCDVFLGKPGSTKPLNQPPRP